MNFTFFYAICPKLKNLSSENLPYPTTKPALELNYYSSLNKSFDEKNSFNSMDRTTTPQTLRLTSTPQSVSAVLNYMERVSRTCSLSPDQHFDVVTCVTEAVNNAIIHGNCRDAKKAVHIKVQQKKNVLAVHISDEGKGFDYNNLPDPTAPEHIECIGGRGVFLMKQLAHRLAFRNNGSTVEMEFKL